MADWSARVEQLLFDGESVETEVEVGTATVVVTSHRVLAFTPQADGKDYRAVDRPNVLGVERTSVDRVDLRERAAKTGVAGAVLALIGVVFDPTAVIPQPDLSAADEADAMGDVGGIVGLVDGMLAAFYALDAFFLVVGGLLLAIGLALAGVQLATRTSQVAITVAGEDEPPILLPDRIDDRSLSTLRTALAPPEPECPE